MKFIIKFGFDEGERKFTQESLEWWREGNLMAVAVDSKVAVRKLKIQEEKIGFANKQQKHLIKISLRKWSWIDSISKR